jgi:hypothetical protein
LLGAFVVHVIVAEVGVKFELATLEMIGTREKVPVVVKLFAAE